MALPSINEVGTRAGQAAQKTLTASPAILAAAASGGSPLALLAGGLVGKGIGAGIDLLKPKKKSPMEEEQKKTTEAVEKVTDTNKTSQKGVFTEMLNVLEDLLELWGGERKDRKKKEANEKFAKEEAKQERIKKPTTRVRPAGKKVTDGFRIGDLIPLFVGLAPIMVASIGAIIAKVFNVDDIIAKLALTIEGMKLGLFAKVSKLFGLEGVFASFMKTFSREGRIGSAIETTQIAFMLAMDWLEMRVNNFLKFFSNEGTLGKIFSSMIARLEPIILSVKAFMTPLVEFFTKTLGPLFAEGGAISKIIKPLAQIFSKIFLPLAFILGLWEAVESTIDNLEREGATWFDGVTGFFGGLLDFFTFGLFDTKSIEKLTDPLRNIFSGGEDGPIMQSFLSLSTALTDIFVQSIGRLTAGIAGLFGFEDVENAIRDFSEEFSLGLMIKENIILPMLEFIDNLINFDFKQVLLDLLPDGTPDWVKKRLVGADTEEPSEQSDLAGGIRESIEMERQAISEARDKRKAELLAKSVPEVGAEINQITNENNIKKETLSTGISAQVIAPQIDNSNVNLRTGDQYHASPGAGSSDSTFNKANAFAFGRR